MFAKIYPLSHKKSPPMNTYRPVILLDDDAEDLDLITDAFKQLNSKQPLLVFKSGFELLHYLKSHPEIHPSVLISDSSLPKMDGEEVVQNIRNMEGRKDIPVVFLTSADTPKSQKKASSLGVQRIYAKPSTFDGLVDILKSIVSEYAEN